MHAVKEVNQHRKTLDLRISASISFVCIQWLFGNGHFRKANDFLREHELTEIVW